MLRSSPLPLVALALIVATALGAHHFPEYHDDDEPTGKTTGSDHHHHHHHDDDEPTGKSTGSDHHHHHHHQHEHMHVESDAFNDAQRVIEAFRGASRATLVLRPFNLSSVRLAAASRFDQMERFNTDFLLSLEDDRLACLYAGSRQATETVPDRKSVG